MPTVQPPSALEFHSDYEIVNWLAKHDNFEAAVGQLRAALATDNIRNGRGLVERWLSVYDDVTAGRAVGSGAEFAETMQIGLTEPTEQAGQPAHGRRTDQAKPAGRAERRGTSRRSGDGTNEDTINSGWMLQEAHLLAETSKEAVIHAHRRVDGLEDRSRRTAWWGKVAFSLALLALMAVGAIGFALWPQLEPHWQALLLVLST